MKRFYASVAVTDDLGLALDGRPVKTPARAPLHLANHAMALAAADEWAAQGTDIDPRTMPVTGFANAVLDRVLPDAAGFVTPLAAYAESELLCYRTDTQPDLAARQAEQWDPILDWARTRFDVSFTLVSGIMHRAQPPETLTRLAAAIASHSPWELAPLQAIITISGSLVIGLALAEQAIDPELAFETAHLDELWQAELWGEDDLALAARDAHRREFLDACRFLALTRG